MSAPGSIAPERLLRGVVGNYLLRYGRQTTPGVSPVLVCSQAKFSSTAIVGELSVSDFNRGGGFQGLVGSALLNEQRQAWIGACIADLDTMTLMAGVNLLAGDGTILVGFKMSRLDDGHLTATGALSAAEMAKAQLLGQFPTAS